jgi:GTP-binding protein
MDITSATFVKGVVGPDEILDGNIPQVAFIGRSNAGKSTLLNSLTHSKKLAITSKTPGRTKEINVFLINHSHYFLDLPGYGYAKTDKRTRDQLRELIFWYLLDVDYGQTVVLLIDAVVGPTADDMEVLKALEQTGRDIVIVANKVDKIKKSHYRNQLNKLKEQTQGHPLVTYSSKSGVGVNELRAELIGPESKTS